MRGGRRAIRTIESKVSLWDGCSAERIIVNGKELEDFMFLLHIHKSNLLLIFTPNSIACNYFCAPWNAFSFLPVLLLPDDLNFLGDVECKSKVFISFLRYLPLRLQTLSAINPHVFSFVLRHPSSFSMYHFPC